MVLVLGITLIATLKKYIFLITRIEKYRPKLLMHTDTKIIFKILVNQIQLYISTHHDQVGFIPRKIDLTCKNQ